MRTFFILSVIALSVFAGERSNFSSPTNAVYQKECGSCHLAYSPALLPSASWQKMMGGLENHFGDDASLPPQVRQNLQEYLSANSMEKAGGKWARKNASAAPLKISELPYFVKEHRKVSNALKNPKVKSWANCTACHPNAAKGDFDEDGVRIPK